MKKIAIATLLAVAALSASAVEVGVTATRDYAGPNHDMGGITIGTKVAGYGVTGGFESIEAHGRRQDRFSVVADKQVATVGPVALTGRVGVAYLDNSIASDGFAMTVGVGASYALTKSTSLTLAADHQYGDTRVDRFDGNRITVGIKTGF